MAMKEVQMSGPSPHPTNMQFSSDIVLGYWAVAHRKSVHERVGKAKPLAWIHIPKTGTSFVETLVHHKGFCPLFPPDGHLPHGAWRQQLRFHKMFLNGIVNHSVYHLCPGVVAWTLSRHIGFCGSVPSGPRISVRALAGSALTVLRHPTKQLMSLFTYFRPKWHWDSPSAMQSIAGECYMNMLVGESCWFPKGDQPAATEDKIQLAIHYLKTYFAFVGIMEQWKLSICLFHAIFGGEMQTFELKNSRPGKKTQRGQAYNVSSLNASRLVAAMRIYNYATLRFRFDLKRYSVTTKTCLPGVSA
eukprot:CAMPEP_0178371228 /NCGR_PEP_ID=MMETSP0689_2-20121128/717_1 /TAXON_ID=160604 /ORGANISM="Amphidinium massartii, Strain CS-259" /LENGTH=301 /DNA_ID=CAMNT_0019991089 /DNA_START=110 /DNA_END=1015 /DNA_ORIENTATION=-